MKICKRSSTKYYFTLMILIIISTNNVNLAASTLAPGKPELELPIKEGDYIIFSQKDTVTTSYSSFSLRYQKVVFSSIVKTNEEFTVKSDYYTNMSDLSLINASSMVGWAFDSFQTSYLNESSTSLLDFKFILPLNYSVQHHVLSSSSFLQTQFFKEASEYFKYASPIFYMHIQTTGTNQSGSVDFFMNFTKEESNFRIYEFTVHVEFEYNRANILKSWYSSVTEQKIEMWGAPSPTIYETKIDLINSSIIEPPIIEKSTPGFIPNEFLGIFGISLMILVPIKKKSATKIT